MASGILVAALVIFHLALFVSFFLYAKERRNEARVVLAFSLSALAVVAWDLARDPAPERFAGLTRGVAIMFLGLWAGAGLLYGRLAGDPDPGPMLGWLAKRGPYWTVAGPVGTLVFSFAAILLGALGTPMLAGPAATIATFAGAALAAGALWLAFVDARPAAQRVLRAAKPDERSEAAHRAARASWIGLAIGLAAVLALIASGAS
ncbi:MAG TPA: hypothetical protein VM889_04895 [Candidatus Thermoplasmatota archaeon]|nr:hypothetical protein [Candidatus Thermoplasmatota archaeon]